MNNIYDIAIIGTGVAGVFAAYYLSEYKDIKTCLIDFGRPPNKRRKQLEGWLGCFPNSNARFYLQDVDKVKKISGSRLTKKANNIVFSLLKNNGPTNETKNKEPKDIIKSRLKKAEYDLNIENYIQWKPENIHKLSKQFSDSIWEIPNLTTMYDTEVFDVSLKDGIFTLVTENGVVLSKKILFCAGRSGWRFSNTIFEKLGLISKNDYSYFGFRAELSSSVMKDWNECHCSISKDNINIGPLSWKGTVIQEDHSDLVISSWRSNEDRWCSDKVSFSVIIKTKFENKGFQQTERLGKLAYILSDSRVGKLKTKEFISSKNDILYIPEYKNIIEEMRNIDKIIPNFIDKSYIYFPNILTYKNTLNLNKDFSTKIDNFYVAGESSGNTGIYYAALSGIVSAISLAK